MLDKINIEMDELEPSRLKLDQHEKEIEHLEIQEMFEIELDSLPVDTLSQSLPEDIPYIVSESSKRQFPNRLTKGIPKATYEPQFSSKVRYPMNQYMSTHHMS